MSGTLTAIVAAVISGITAAILAWGDKKKASEGERQLGILEYENVATKEALARAKAADRTEQIVGSMSGDELAERMRRTNDLLEQARNK